MFECTFSAQNNAIPAIAGVVNRVRPQLTFLFIVSHECRAYEIVKWELNKLILCDMSAFEQEYSQVCF